MHVRKHMSVSVLPSVTHTAILAMRGLLVLLVRLCVRSATRPVKLAHS